MKNKLSNEQWHLVIKKSWKQVGALVSDVVIGHAYYHNGQKNKYNLKIHCQANGIKTV